MQTIMLIVRVWCMRLNKHMQMSAVGRAGVQRSMCCVLEVRKQRSHSMRRHL